MAFKAETLPLPKYTESINDRQRLEKKRIIEKEEMKIDDFMIYSPIKQHCERLSGSSLWSAWRGGPLEQMEYH